MSIILTLLILGVIIFVHEFGHFATAKFFKMPVSEFSLGMGPKLFGVKRGATEYNLRAIPIGGFVNIDGMEPESTLPDGFNTKKPHERLIVLFAGVFMNFMLAWVVIISVFLIFGEYEAGNSNEIGTVEEGSFVSNLLFPGDKVVKIDGIETKKWEDVFEVLSKKKEEKVSLVIDRKGTVMSFDAKMRYEKSQERYVLGIRAGVEHKQYTFSEAFVKGNKEFLNLFVLTFKGLKMVFSFQVPLKDIKGPVGTVQIVDMFSQWGYQAIIYLAAIMSVSVGVFNMLPFPALDGGRIIFVIIELFGFKVNRNTEEAIHRVGLLILLTLMAFMMFNDVYHWNTPISIK